MKSSNPHYLKVVEWSDEDACYIGSAPPLIGRCCHGKKEAEVYNELGVIVDEWLENFRKDGKPLPANELSKDFSGKFVLRIDPEIHKALAIRATQEGDSINRCCEKLIEYALGKTASGK